MIFKTQWSHSSLSEVAHFKHRHVLRNVFSFHFKEILVGIKALSSDHAARARIWIFTLILPAWWQTWGVTTYWQLSKVSFYNAAGAKLFFKILFLLLFFKILFLWRKLKKRCTQDTNEWCMQGQIQFQQMSKGAVGLRTKINWMCPTVSVIRAGLPDGIVWNQKFQFGKILEGLAVEEFRIFCGHSVNFAAIWNIL
jgi:hypothetical protein